MFDQNHRNTAARHGYVKTPKDTRMRFRLVKVYPIETVPADRSPFGTPFDAAPMDIELLSYSCPSNPAQVVGGIVRWDPPADKIDGLIKLSDLVASRNGGNPAAICDCDIDLSVVEESKGAKRWNTYTFKLTDGTTGVTPAGTPVPTTPAAPLPPAAPVPPPATGMAPPPVGTPPAPPPPPATPTPQQVVSEATREMIMTNTLADLDAALGRHWQAATTARVTAEVQKPYRQHKARICERMLLCAADAAALQAAWNVAYNATAEDPDGRNLCTAAYHKRNAGIAAGDPPDEDIPF